MLRFLQVHVHWREAFAADEHYEVLELTSGLELVLVLLQDQLDEEVLENSFIVILHHILGLLHHQNIS